MAIDPVKIPQNVYVEDRIIGPVTLRQIIITGLGAGLSYVLYSAFIRTGLTGLTMQILAWTPAVIGAAFAFLRINDLSLLRIILLFIEGLNKPHERTWVAHPGLTINLVTRQTRQEETRTARKSAEAEERLAEMTRLLEKRQQEINALAAKDVPRPEATEPVRTHFQDVIAQENPVVRGAQEHTDEEPAVSNVHALPVRHDRIRASTMDPQYCIDTIVERLPRFGSSRDPLLS